MSDNPRRDPDLERWDPLSPEPDFSQEPPDDEPDWANEPSDDPADYEPDFSKEPPDFPTPSPRLRRTWP